jgi:DDE_Tnp_1-associated
MDARLNRRVLGVLAARLPEARLDQVKDPRNRKGRRWKLEILLRAVLVAIVAGCKGLAQAEALTAEMSAAARRRLGLARRIADTTLRDLLCMLEPEELRRPLHAVVRAAHRRKYSAPQVGDHLSTWNVCPHPTLSRRERARSALSGSLSLWERAGVRAHVSG